MEHPNLLQDLNENWTNVLPISLQFDRVYTNFTDEQLLNISTEIRKFYFNDQTISEDKRQQLTNVYSDRLFNQGVRKCAVLLSEHSPVYSYQFAHNRGDYSILRWFNIDKIFGKMTIANMVKNIFLKKFIFRCFSCRRTFVLIRGIIRTGTGISKGFNR